MNINLENLTPEQRQSIQEQLDKYNKHNIGKPKYGDKYWFISDTGSVLAAKWYDDGNGNAYYSIGNVFLTKEDAVREARIRELDHLLRKASRKSQVDWKSSNFKWKMYYAHGKGTVYTEYNTYYQTSPYVFSNKEHITKEIREQYKELMELYNA